MKVSFFWSIRQGCPCYYKMMHVPEFITDAQVRKFDRGMCSTDVVQSLQIVFRFLFRGSFAISAKSSSPACRARHWRLSFAQSMRLASAVDGKAWRQQIQDNELDEAFGVWRSVSSAHSLGHALTLDCTSLFPAIICDFSSNFTDFQLRKFNFTVVSCMWNVESIAEHTPCTSSECNTECPSSRFAYRSNVILFILINNWMKNLYILCCSNVPSSANRNPPLTNDKWKSKASFFNMGEQATYEVI